MHARHALVSYKEHQHAANEMKVIPEDFFEGYELTDPICMSKLLSFVKEHQDEDEAIIQKLIERESLMMITWHQPWYHTEGTLTKAPPARHDEDMFRTDKITPEESDIIDKNWKKFRKWFGIPDKPRCLARIKTHSAVKVIKKIRLYLAQFLARGLQRCMEQVYHHFVRKYAYKDAETYTEVEHQVIKVCLIHSPDDASTIACYVLAREPRCVFRKINELKDNVGSKPLDMVKFPFKKKFDFSKRNKWTLILASKFLNSLLKHSNLELEQIKNKDFTLKVWKAVEKEMGIQSKYMKDFWYSKLHVQLFTQTKLKRNIVVKKVFKTCQALGYKRWTEINWKDLALRYFPDGVTGLFLYKLSFKCLLPFKEILKVDLNEAYTYILEHKAIKNKVNYQIKLLEVNDQGQLVLREQVDIKTENHC